MSEPINKKFSTNFKVGTRVILKKGKPKEYTITEISDGRTYIRLRHETGIFLHSHVLSYTNKPFENTGV